MRRLFITFLAFLLISNQCFALQVPVSNMQNTFSGVIQQKLVNNGINANDPRFLQTVAGSSGAIAAGVVAGGLSATVTAGATWATVAAGLVLGGAVALVGVAVTLAVTGAVTWIFTSDGHIQEGVNPASPNTPAGLAAPPVIYCGDNYVCATSIAGYCGGQPPHAGGYNGQQGTFIYAMGADGHCHAQFKFDTTSTTVDLGALADPKKSTANISSCPGINLIANAGICPASNFPEPSPAPVKTAGDAVADVPAAEKLKPLNPVIVADMANEMWREAAAAPGYAGIPYDATKPITVADVATYEAANPTTYPTVGDFVSPQTAPAGSPATSPFTLPTSPSPVTTQDPTATPSTGTNPSTQPLENLGPDPGIGAPALETIPTAQQILSPLLNLFPTLKNFAVPNHGATCPKWTVHVFDQDISTQAHCTLMEQARPTASTVMTVVWALVALFIVLAA